MPELLKFEIQTICLTHIVAIILSIVFFMMFYMKTSKNYSVKCFLLMQTSMIGWMVFKIFKTVSPTELSRWWFIVAYYFCACVFEVAFLEFTYAYYKGKAIAGKIRILLYLLPVVQFIWVLTNPYHYLFYSSYNFRRDSFGPLFYVHTAIVYAFISLGFIYGYLTFNRQVRHKNPRYKFLIASAIIIPLIINFLFITKTIHRFAASTGIPVIFDITPIVFVWSTMIFVYATWKHDFFNLSPLMKDEIVHKLDTAICVLDSSYNVVYSNEKTAAEFDKKAMPAIKKLMKKNDESEICGKKLEVQMDDIHCLIFIKSVDSFKKRQYIVTLRNTSDYRLVESEMTDKQNELMKIKHEIENTIISLKETSRIGARNYVARELHDIIGHSLVVTIKLLEVAKLYHGKNKPLSLSALEDADLSIQSGIESMNAILIKEDTRSSYNGEMLKIDIEKILDHIRYTKIGIKFYFKGLYYKIDEKLYEVILRICKELLTNTIKHSNAKEIFISISVKTHILNMTLMDNGSGCQSLQKGNGLKGIEERLKSVNGSIKFITSKNDGFISRIRVDNTSEN